MKKIKKNKRPAFAFHLLVFLVLFSSGLHALEKIAPQDYPDFSSDDGRFDGLEESVRASLSYYRSQPPDTVFRFGSDSYTAAHMIHSLETFLALRREPSESIDRKLKELFWVYRSTGLDARHSVTYSAYYEHSMKASLTRTEKYRYPLYQCPGDLAVPYYTRQEIDSKNLISGRGLEIAWADDPMDIFFLQVQGSGWLHLPTGEQIRIRYAGNNGHPYRSVGLHMIETGLIPKEKFNRQSMRDYMDSHPLERQDLLNVNPRYVFFQLDRSTESRLTFGSLKVPLTRKRSVATDPA
ncbi:MAG: MltA domain-containing protein, partial [Elusimicrobia bacterium]|nr:MltA domain-containing protein [Elusimicrobiota bacterium]